MHCLISVQLTLCCWPASIGYLVYIYHRFRLVQPQRCLNAVHWPGVNNMLWSQIGCV
jgi:hypothetical protein